MVWKLYFLWFENQFQACFNLISYSPELFSVGFSIIKHKIACISLSKVFLKSQNFLAGLSAGQKTIGTENPMNHENFSQNPKILKF